MPAGDVRVWRIQSELDEVPDDGWESTERESTIEASLLVLGSSLNFFNLEPLLNATESRLPAAWFEI